MGDFVDDGDCIFIAIVNVVIICELIVAIFCNYVVKVYSLLQDNDGDCYREQAIRYVVGAIIIVKSIELAVILNIIKVTVIL